MGKQAAPFHEYMIAGGAAGIVSRTCIAPVERVKIIFQVKKGSLTSAKTSGVSTAANSGGYASIVRSIIQKEGPLALWRGNSVAVIRVAPYMSLQFSAFEKAKQVLRDRLALDGTSLSLVAGGVAGEHVVPSAT